MSREPTSGKGRAAIVEEKTGYASMGRLTAPPPALDAFVRRDDLSVVFQPIVRVDPFRIFAYEALVRCRVPEFRNPTVVATGTTAAGSRNAVADANGNAYVPDPGGGTLLILGRGGK